MNTKEANRIIDAMGGTVQVAKIFNVTKGAIPQWRKNGIPQARMMYIEVVRPDLFAKQEQQAA